MKAAILAAAAFCLTVPAVSAGPIATACGASGRAASPLLCGCIQKVADLTLTGADQRLAATFFRDPAKAQDMRVSRKRKHQEFWARYANFGATAEQICSD